jgi:DHA2 family multidrug resistance protein
VKLDLHVEPFQFDSIGLSLLVIVMVCWEVMLSKGQEWDWLSDPFWPAAKAGRTRGRAEAA